MYTKENLAHAKTLSPIGALKYLTNYKEEEEFEACNGCGSDHDPEDCLHGFNEFGLQSSIEPYDVAMEEELTN